MNIPSLRVDWFRMFADLDAAGYSLRMVSAEIEIPKSTLIGWKNIPNTEPKFADGMKLITLWRELTGKTMLEVPRTNGRESDRRVLE